MPHTSCDEARHLAFPIIIQQLAEGVIVADTVGTIIFVIEAAAAIHGVARLDIKPNAYADTYHLYREDGRPYPSEDLPLARAVRGETVKDARWRIKRPDGRDVLAIGTAQPLRTANGRRIGAVLTLQDATAQDVAERSLKKSQTELREVRDRLSERSKAEAHGDHAPGQEAPSEEAPSQDVQRRLKDASRQIKAPLQEILAHTQWMLQTSSLEDVRIHGELVRAAGGALLSMVDTLLGLAGGNRTEASPSPRNPRRRRPRDARSADRSAARQQCCGCAAYRLGRPSRP